MWSDPSRPSVCRTRGSGCISYSGVVETLRPHWVGPLRIGSAPAGTAYVRLCAHPHEDERASLGESRLPRCTLAVRLSLQVKSGPPQHRAYRLPLQAVRVGTALRGGWSTRLGPTARPDHGGPERFASVASVAAGYPYNCTVLLRGNCAAKSKKTAGGRGRAPDTCDAERSALRRPPPSASVASTERWTAPIREEGEEGQIQQHMPRRTVRRQGTPTLPTRISSFASVRACELQPTKRGAFKENRLRRPQLLDCVGSLGSLAVASAGAHSPSHARRDERHARRSLTLICSAAARARSLSPSALAVRHAV